jgi:transposase
MGRSRGGLSSKIHAVVDANGLPVQLALTAGEAHDNRLAGKLLSRLKSGTMLLADRGYDADWIRVLAAKKGVWANIPPKCNRKSPICFSPYLYRARNSIERFFNKIKQCRRVATRYDKLAANYLAFVQLASIRVWLGVNEYTPQHARTLLSEWIGESFWPVQRLPAQRAAFSSDQASVETVHGPWRRRASDRPNRDYQ